MDLPELHSLAVRVTGPLERALAKECITGVFGSELQLRYSLCGVATAALQKYLERQHGIQTKRNIVDIPSVSTSASFRKLSHVMLQHESIMIDPTYGQFMTYAGLRVQDVLEDQALEELYPPDKIAVVEDTARTAFASGFARHIQSVLPRIRQLPDRDRLHAPDGALMRAPLETIDGVFQKIYTKENARYFPTHRYDGIDELTDDIVAHMEREEFGTIEL